MSFPLFDTTFSFSSNFFFFFFLKLPFAWEILYKMTRKMPWVTLQAEELLRVSVSGKVLGGFLRNVLPNTEENALDNILENPSENTWESA